MTYLDVGNDAGFLDPGNGFSVELARQVRINRETFPVSTSQGCTPERPSIGAKGNIDALAFELATHVEAALVREIPVPACAGMQRRGVCVDKLRGPDSVAGIVQAHARPVESRDRPRGAGAYVVRFESAGNVDLFFQGHLADQRAGAPVGGGPLSFAFAMG